MSGWNSEECRLSEIANLSGLFDFTSYLKFKDNVVLDKLD